MLENLGVFYVPENAGLHIPFVGEIDVVFWLIVLAVASLFWKQIPVLLTWLFTSAGPALGAKLVAIVEKFFAKKNPPDAPSPATTPSAPSAAPSANKSATPIKNVHELVEWSIANKDPEALAKATSFYSVIQKSVAAALLLLFAGCSQDPGKGRCGWEKPSIGPAQRQAVFGEPDDSLKSQAPQHFKNQ